MNEDVIDEGSLAAEEWLSRLDAEQIAALNELIAVSIRQIDNGEIGDPDMEKLLAEGRARRAGAIAAE